MESSAISLYFPLLRRASPDAAPQQQEYLINLIDSPGHIDFSSEVSTASRLCDGAVVLVDAVEGVCSQTITVLRQTWIEKLKPLLVINKMDRLVTELKMSAAEAYTHLSKLLEQVNAVMGSFFAGERMEDDLKWRERVEERITAASARAQERADGSLASNAYEISHNGEEVDTDGTSAQYEEKDDEEIYFAPEKNNVIFGSAIDGWAFTVRQFASLYEKKLGIKRSILEKVLWGDFYLDPKTKRVLGSKHLKGRNLKPMFVQLVLENIWAVYEATTGGSSGKGCVDLPSSPCIYSLTIRSSYYVHLLQRFYHGRKDHQILINHPTQPRPPLARPSRTHDDAVCIMAASLNGTSRLRRGISAVSASSSSSSHTGHNHCLARWPTRRLQSPECHDQLQDRQGRASGRIR